MIDILQFLKEHWWLPVMYLLVAVLLINTLRPKDLVKRAEKKLRLSLAWIAKKDEIAGSRGFDTSVELAAKTRAKEAKRCKVEGGRRKVIQEQMRAHL